MPITSLDRDRSNSGVLFLLADSTGAAGTFRRHLSDQAIRRPASEEGVVAAALGPKLTLAATPKKCPLCGAKRTSQIDTATSPNDPSRHFATIR
jgi:hypothetical protein